jgi:hypothetical protein
MNGSSSVTCVLPNELILGRPAVLESLFSLDRSSATLELKGAIHADARSANPKRGSLTEQQIGTNDTFIGFTFLYGDALSMFDDSQGGNDTLTPS